jgi:hypothetical protein
MPGFRDIISSSFGFPMARRGALGGIAMSQFQRAGFAALMVALGGCYNAQTIDNDATQPTDSAGKPMDDKESDGIVPLPTDSGGMPTDESSSEWEAPFSSDSAVKPTDMTETDWLTLTDEKVTDSIAPIPTDSAESPTEPEAADTVTAASRKNGGRGKMGDGHGFCPF